MNIYPTHPQSVHVFNDLDNVLYLTREGGSVAGTINLRSCWRETELRESAGND